MPRPLPYLAPDRSFVFGLCTGVVGLAMVGAAVLDHLPAARPLLSPSAWLAPHGALAEMADAHPLHMTPVQQSPDNAGALLAEASPLLSFQGGLSATPLRQYASSGSPLLRQPASLADHWRISDGDPSDRALQAKVGTNASHSWLYPQNGVTLWDRIRVSTKRDRRAYLLGTAIQLHAPATAATPGPRH